MVQTLLQRYRDIPDGTECHRKTYASTTLSGAAGLIFSAYSVTLQPPDSFLEGVARTGRYTFTAAAIGAIFGLTSCISAQVREKPDDPLNYFIGGCAGGLTLGARTPGKLIRGPFAERPSEHLLWLLFSLLITCPPSPDARCPASYSRQTKQTRIQMAG
uniref:NADH dehydrogenase [ubiquinone] 1 alpha subcomplex subunit 11 n=1 Tax=Felis catus TaxID=9685 RepID=A0ABI7ZVH7_FELCA